MEEFAAGWTAGAVGVLLTHPLDTLRVRVQCGVGSTLRKEAISLLSEGRGMWAGLASPIACVGLWKAVMFSASAYTQRILSEPGASQAPLANHFAGGYAAGAAGLIVQMPMEKIKCCAQTSQEVLTRGIHLEMAAARHIWHTEGLAGFYRGTMINATLCPPAIAVWFGTNELLLRRADELACSGELPAGRSNLLVQMVCGGVGGLLAWALNYPSDRAKACIQVASIRQPGASSMELLHPYLKEEGARFFVRGISATLLRALPQCGITICVQARASQLLRERGGSLDHRKRFTAGRPSSLND